MRQTLYDIPGKPFFFFKRWPFHVQIGTIFTLLVLAILLVIGGLTRFETRRMVDQSAGQVFQHVGQEVGQQVRLLRRPVEQVVEFSAALDSLLWAESARDRLAQFGFLLRLLEAEPQISTFYYAAENGAFVVIRPLRDAAARKDQKLPENTAVLVQYVESGSREYRWSALSGERALLASGVLPEAPPDLRTFSWYRAAIVSRDLIRTAPHVLANGKPGRTVALRNERSHFVVAADLATDTLSGALAGYRVTPSSELAIFDEDGGVLAFHDPAKAYAKRDQGQPVMASLAGLSPVMAQLAGERATLFEQSRMIKVDGREWSVRVIPLMTEASRDFLALAAPVDELMADVSATQRFLLGMYLLMMLLSLPIVWLVAKRIANQLETLTEETAAIRRFDFKSDVPLRTSVREIHDLGLTIRQMKQTIQKFLEVSTALAAERNFDILLARVLDEIRAAAGSDGGVVYLFDEAAGTLTLAAQGWINTPGDSADREMVLSCTQIDHPVVVAAMHRQTVSQSVISSPWPEGLLGLDARYGRQEVLMVALPLLGRTGQLVGVICNFMAPGQAAPSVERMALVGAFAGAAAVAIDQQRLLQSQKALLEAFIGLVAGAIDAKSPYTGGHCQRVPDLTEMLARAAHDSNEPPFADFRLDEDEWEAIRIAGWLHDCGKVTTPEYVVDKATKLETIYNRIHEIRMRFEVIKRDAEIDALRAIAAGGDAAVVNERLQGELRQLDEEFHFVATCNEGGEFMSPDKAERLRSIARRGWQRTLDDRLGLSWEERARVSQTPPASLPATEQLLADKPEHVIERSQREMMPADNPWGFRLTVPASLYNRGELYNLAVGRGTLTEEERYKINDHIVQTIIMLSQLPFPAHLKGVVEMAGGHHEKMDGTGYPKGLKREEMSLPARIMAISDIFEALTAGDRPYKAGKKLSEAIRIMGFMAKDGHIDPDLFNLFLKSGVYRIYGEKYLQPEFVDEVDVSALSRA